MKEAVGDTPEYEIVCENPLKEKISIKLAVNKNFDIYLELNLIHTNI
jgi:hypothetical protein